LNSWFFQTFLSLLNDRLSWLNDPREASINLFMQSLHQDDLVEPGSGILFAIAMLEHPKVL
jgi:hypothetical protein